MKKNLLIMLLSIAVLGLVLCVCGVFDRDTNMRAIAVSGECITTAPKDKTAITLRVRTLDASPAMSMQRATKQITAITDYLKAQDVEMQTTDFESREKTEWNPEARKYEPLGFETSIAIEVSATSVEKIERVLSRFAGMPDVYTENLRMYTSDQAMKPVLEKCMSVAVENARARADALAAADGNRAGKMLSVSYGNTSTKKYQPQPTYYSSVMSADSVDSIAGSIVSTDTDVSVTVSAVFEIK